MPKEIIIELEMLKILDRTRIRKLYNNIDQVDFFPIFSDIYLVPDIKLNAV